MQAKALPRASAGWDKKSLWPRSRLCVRTVAFYFFILISPLVDWWQFFSSLPFPIPAFPLHPIARDLLILLRGGSSEMSRCRRGEERGAQRDRTVTGRNRRAIRAPLTLAVHASARRRAFQLENLARVAERGCSSLHVPA